MSNETEDDDNALSVRVETGWPLVAILALSPVWVPAIAAGVLAAIATFMAIVALGLASAICIGVPAWLVIVALEAYVEWSCGRKLAAAKARALEAK